MEWNTFLDDFMQIISFTIRKLYILADYFYVNCIYMNIL